MLQEVQKGYYLVLSGDEKEAKLLHGFIRLEHFCIVVSRNTEQQHGPQFGALL